MALYAELTLHSHNGQTRIDVQVDGVQNGMHEELWRRSFLANVSADDQVMDLAPWLHASLQPVLAFLAGFMPGHEVLDQVPAAAVKPAETTLDLGEPLEP